MCSNQTQVSTDSAETASKQLEGKTLFTNLLLGNYMLRIVKLLSDTYRKTYRKELC